MVDDATGVPEGTRVVSLSCGARIGGSALRRRRTPGIKGAMAARPVVLAVFLGSGGESCAAVGLFSR